MIGDSAAAGRMGRILGAGATEMGLGYSSDILNNARNMMGMMPGVWDASQYYMNQGTNALKGYGTAMGMAAGDADLARGVFNDVSNPLAYNSLYGSALDRQQNSIDSMLAARGLATGGPGLQAEAASNLSDQFAMRQRQEQMSALDRMNQATGTYGNLASGYGNLSGMLAQIPGSIYSSLGGALQGFGSLAGLPQNIVGTGMDLWRTGTSMPLETFQDVYNSMRGPQLAGGQLINSSN